MSIIEFIKSLIPDIKLPENVTINFNILSGNSITTKKNIEIHKDNTNNVLNLTYFPQNNSDDTNNQLKKVINDTEAGTSILEEEPREKLSLIRSSPTEEYIETINFFRGKIPRDDIRVLELANVIRGLMDKGEAIVHIRNDIQIKYGIRGRNLSNLFTAGYFESHIKPLYEELISQGSPNEFKDKYERVIADYSFAVFVASGKKIDFIKAEILKKIKLNRELGNGVINLHGIGESNIRAIKTCLKDPEISSEMNAEPDLDSDGRIFVATIYF